MIRKYMKGIAVLAVLLISLISISSAAVPRAMPDLFKGQCGVELSVSAPGILGNDIKTTSPLSVKDPGTISIDPKYGTLMVNADGSFVYNSAQNIPSGTYVYFYYTATDGINVTNNALVKIAVSCKCTGVAPDINVCLGTAISPAYLMSKGAGCMGCRDATPKFDLSKIPAQPVAGQCYPYTVSCPNCALVTGHVCFSGPCAINSVPFTVCSGITPTIAQITAQGSVTCSCDVAPVISNVHLVGDHFEYTITCQSECGPATGTGIVNIQTPCTPTSTPFIICSGVTPTATMILANGAVSCGTGVCDTTPVISGIHIVGDHWEYTITCTTANGCSANATGIVNIETVCVPTSVAFTICSGVTPTIAMITANGVVSCGACDATPAISNIHIVGNHWEYTITCTTALGCSANATGIVNIGSPCVPTSEAFTICSGVTPTIAMITANGVVSCGECDATPVISNINLVGNHWEYTITCTSAVGCSATATGIVNIETPCVPTSTPFAICSGVTPTAEMIMADGSVTCGTGTCDTTPVVSGIHIAGNHWEYTITCTTALGCSATATGIVNIGPTCGFVSPPVAFSLPAGNCPNIIPADDEIISLAGLVCTCPDSTPVISGVHVLSVVDDITTWEYTAFCGTPECGSSITGQFDNRDCQECNCAPTAPNMCGCQGYPFPMALFTSLGGGCHASCDVTMTPVIDVSQVDFNTPGHTYPYTVTCPGCSGENSEVTGYIYIRTPLCGPNGNCICPTHCP